MAERLGGLVDHRLDGFIIARVDGKWDDAASRFGGQLCGSRLERLHIPGHDSDVHAFEGKPPRDGFSDPPASTRYDGRFPAKFEIHAPLLIGEMLTPNGSGFTSELARATWRESVGQQIRRSELNGERRDDAN